MKKWMLILGGLAALVIGAAAALLVSINPIVEAGVNMYGPDITGTHVFLKKADISVFSGKGSLHGFTLGNPKGYNAPHAVKVDSLSMELDKDSLLEDVIVIRRIAVDSPDIIYEISKKSNNFDDIIKNVKQMAGAAEKSATRNDVKADAKDEGAGKKVVIDELIIRNAKAAVSIPMLKLNISVPLPEIRLTDIGRDKSGKSNGVTMAEAAERVLKALSGSLGTASRQVSGNVQSGTKQAVEKTRDTLKATGDKLKEGLGSLFKQQ